MKNEVIIISIMLIVPIVFLYLIMLIKQWLDNIGNNGNTKKRLNKHTYKKEVDKVYPKKLNRERPPNASFFCRVNGKETFIEGPYEEQFLDRYERIKWKYKKILEKKEGY